ncbi:MAG: glycosyltransferase [Bryobacteraceae bacterium]
MDSFRHREALIEWLAGLDWSNPWRESNRIMHLLSAFLFALLWDGKPWAAERYHDVLDWLDQRQDPRTGLWGTDCGATTLNAAAGAYHFVPFYRYARRPVRCWPKIVDACLELQNDDGLFASAAGGGACEDLDAIDLLCTSVRSTGRLTPEIQKALTRAFWAIWNMQREEGGFPYSDVKGKESYLYSSWPAMAARQGGSDVWATWARLCSLHTIRALLTDDLPDIGRWTFRRLPALGFHLQSTSIPEDAPMQHRSIWFRPLPAPAAPAAPRVAVVVTCFNLGEYVAEALASVKAQTLDDVETVVVDDGSRDAFTVARLDALAADGWQVIRTENRGLPAARNLGIRETRAEYVCCLDADDRLRPLYLQKAVAALQANERAGFVSCFYELFDGSEGRYCYRKPGLPRMLARNEAVCASVFRREAWAEAGGYCESLPAMQDWDLWISILEKGWEGELVPEVLFDYRIRLGSMYSETRKPANYARIAAMIRARHAALYDQYATEVHRLMARQFAESADYALKKDDALRTMGTEARRLWARLQRAPAGGPRQGEGPQDGGPLIRPSLPAPEEAGLGPHRLFVQGGAAHPVSFLRTALWSLFQTMHPRGAWRAARNLALFVRIWLRQDTRNVWRQYFDEAFYVSGRPDVAAAGVAPSIHYLLAGAWENADPSPGFSSANYWKRNPDVAAAGWNPLVHFVAFGRMEGRIALPARLSSSGTAFDGRLIEQGTITHSPVVSVVIPCFNLGRYVEEAVWSVLRQTWRDLEVIVVEGGSTEPETMERVRRLERAQLPGVRVLYRDQPCLAGDNRNFGISRARGRYVCCLDADDVLDSSYLETAVFAAEFGDYDFVYPSLEEFGSSSGQWLVDDPSWPGILRENRVSTVALFRREVWERLDGFRDWGKGSAHVPEDWDFWIRAVAAGFRGKAIRDTLMKYRVLPGSLSRQKTGGMHGMSVRIRDVHRNLERLKAPPPRPVTAAGRLKWACLAADAGPTVMLVIPFYTLGGAERIFQSLIREWRRRCTRVIVVATLQLAAGIPDRIDELRGLTPHVYALPALFPEREDLQSGFLYFLLRRYRPRLVFTAGSDLFYRLLPEIKRHFPDIRIVDQLFNDEIHFHTNRTFAHLIDCTVVPGSRIAHRLLTEFREKPHRVAVVRHSIRPPRMTQGLLPRGWPKEFAQGAVVGFFGRMSAEKAPLDFVKIAGKVLTKRDDVRFLMTGDGPEMANVRKEVRRRRLGDRIHLAGFVEDTHEWMAACSLVILPSHLDGMPLVVLEAQALGKPVIASNVGSVPEMIEDGVTGILCEPGDIEGFASAVLRLLESEELCCRMGEAGRERVGRLFAEEAMLERYFELFERVCGDSSRTAE